ncbi:MAG: hypothetical protein PHN49_07490 [Candidatus Omnitrophica bacterium]|nr:hypothetical protein [Candidatus Omnitrophota bacterium]MDD5671465.1 hypothetical protein [Candidatus Omnitrophota bacterium]
MGDYGALAKEGLIRIVSASVPLNAEMRTMQESHNANHALYYLSLVLHSIIHPMKRDWSSQSKAQRIIAHLSCLYEFMSEEDCVLKIAVKSVMDRLSQEPLDCAELWARFLYEHWNALEVISGKYSLDHACFCHDQYQKLEDIIYRRHYVKIWWWHGRVLKGCRQMKKWYARMKARIS